ncbi:unnamed protein product, partial [Meganyctiphanes norvegica]
MKRIKLLPLVLSLFLNFIFSSVSMEISDSNSMQERRLDDNVSHLNNFGTIKRSGEVLEENLNSLVVQGNQNNTGLAVLEKCYGIYGCYRIDQPFLSLARPLNVFPQDPKEITPNLCLYTRTNPTDCQVTCINHKNASTPCP